MQPGLARICPGTWLTMPAARRSISVPQPRARKGRLRREQARSRATYLGEWGESGWYSEVLDRKEGEILLPKDFAHIETKAFAEAIMTQIPKDKRIPIGDPY